MLQALAQFGGAGAQLFFFDDVQHPPTGRCDDRPTGGHPFDYDPPERFRLRRTVDNHI